MIVCVCHRVSDRDIARVAEQGCASFEELQAELRVSTACGKCRDCALDTFHRHAAPAAVAPSPGLLRRPILMAQTPSQIAAR